LQEIIMGNLDVVKTWFQRVYTDEDLSAIDEMMESRTKARGLAEHPLLGPEEFKGFVTGLLALLGNVRITIDKSMEDDDWVHVLVTVRGACRKTDKQVSFPAQLLLKIEGGKLIEGYNSLDFMSLFGQLGLLPENSFATCFGGDRIG